MPIYEYKCGLCGHEFEVEQKLSVKGLLKCPRCGNISFLQKQISKTNFILKGGGWAANGYEKRSSKK
jgi:putative FmdB family regulatory protein